MTSRRSAQVLARAAGLYADREQLATLWRVHPATNDPWRGAPPVDYYESLGVSPHASDAVIRAAYRARLKEVHPDTGTTSIELEQVLEAGTMLLEPASRKAYDQQRAREVKQQQQAQRVSAQQRERQAYEQQRALIQVRRPEKRRWKWQTAGTAALALVVGIVYLLLSTVGTGDEVLSAGVLPQIGSSDESPEAASSPLPESVAEMDEESAEDSASVAEIDEESAEDSASVAEMDEESAEDSASVADEESEESEESAGVEADESSESLEEPALEAEVDDERPASDDQLAETDSSETDEGTNLAELPDLASLPERGAIYRPPTLFLVGAVPNREMADALYAKAVAVVGAENVVDDYVIHPDAPLDVNGNVRVEQAITFETLSAEIRPEFLPILGLALQVLAQNPQASLVIEGHTDSLGDADKNQRLSERRATAVVAWLVAQGIEPDRLTSIGFGESTPVADNATEEGRSINRRIEVQIIDLLS